MQPGAPSLPCDLLRKVRAVRNNPCPHLHSCLVYLPLVFSQQGRKSKLQDSAGHLWVLSPRCLLPSNASPPTPNEDLLTCPEGVHHTLSGWHGGPQRRQQTAAALGAWWAVPHSWRPAGAPGKREADERNGQSRVESGQAGVTRETIFCNNRAPGARRVRHRPCPQVPEKGNMNQCAKALSRGLAAGPGAEFRQPAWERPGDAWRKCHSGWRAGARPGGTEGKASSGPLLSSPLSAPAGDSSEGTFCDPSPALPLALGSPCAWSPDMVKTESLLDSGAATLAFSSWRTGKPATPWGGKKATQDLATEQQQQSWPYFK